MPSFQTLANIADIYIPLLAFLCAWLLYQYSLKRNRLKLVCLGGLLVVSIALVYAIRFMDKYFEFWLYFGWDYSTHSALSLVLVMCLSVMWQRLLTLWLISLLGYFLLMVYQQYHSVIDIVSTVIVVAGILLPLFYRISNTLTRHEPST